MTNPTANLDAQYDYIVCGSGSSGSVVARRLAEVNGATVLLIEAGGQDNIEAVSNASLWPTNLGSTRSWVYQSEPDPNLNGRSMTIDAGRVLGGGSSINVMTWAQGHPTDWDYFAAETGNPDWGWESVKRLYQEIEDWHGKPDPNFRGQGGPVYVEPANDPSPLALALLKAAASRGIPAFDGHNGLLMQQGGGCSLLESCLRNGKRESIYRRYVGPVVHYAKLTIATNTRVTRIVLHGGRATGVEVLVEGTKQVIRGAKEIILCLGAIQTPKVLLQSGIGDSHELRKIGIQTHAHLPGVGRNYQDHLAIDVNWELKEPLQPRNAMCEAVVFWKSDVHLPAPDVQGVQVEVPLTSVENSAVYEMPEAGWGFFGGNVRPKSRGFLRLTGPDHEDPIAIHSNALSEPDDLAVARFSVELFRELGNSSSLAQFSRREVAPGALKGPELDRFIRNGLRTFYHQSCTAKMGRDEASVVDGNLKVHGIEGLRVADASIMPRITTGNTMAPCVIIGELASRYILADSTAS